MLHVISVGLCFGKIDFVGCSVGGDVNVNVGDDVGVPVGDVVGEGDIIGLPVGSTRGLVYPAEFLKLATCVETLLICLTLSWRASPIIL